MKTFRPDYMDQSSPIQVFRTNRINSIVIFSIRLGEKVQVIEKNVLAMDPATGLPYPRVRLHKIIYNGKVGFVNRRWLR